MNFLVFLSEINNKSPIYPTTRTNMEIQSSASTMTFEKNMEKIIKTQSKLIKNQAQLIRFLEAKMKRYNINFEEEEGIELTDED